MSTPDELTIQLLNAAHRALCLLEAHGTGKLAKTPAGDDLRAAIQSAAEHGLHPDWDKKLYGDSL